MKTKHFNIDAYMKDVESKFSGVNGSTYGFDNNSELELGFDAQPALMAQPMAQVQLKQAAPYQITVTNSTLAPLTAVLFGYNIYGQAINQGSSVGVVITPSAGVPYLQLLTQSASQPFETSLIRISSTNVSQVQQALSIVSSDASGQSATIPLYPTSYFSANQFQSGIIDIPYSVKIEGNTYISFTILAGSAVTGATTVVFDFFPMNKFNSARNLNGQSALQQYATPNVPVAGMPLYVSTRNMGQATIGAGNGRG